MCQELKEFIDNAVSDMEDHTHAKAYKPSFAGGGSGLSFGEHQLDVAKNSLAASAFQKILGAYN